MTYKLFQYMPKNVPMANMNAGTIRRFTACRRRLVDFHYQKRWIPLFASKRSVYTISIDELKAMSPDDIQYELVLIKQRMGSSFADQKYGEALGYARDLESKVEILMGNTNLTYASCVNNVAYAEKQLGNYKRSMDNYTRAIHLYEDLIGKSNTSYASSLANIGLLYKAMFEEAIAIANNPDGDFGLDEDGKPKKKMAALERLQLLNSAEQALTDSLRIMTDVHGTEKKETLSTSLSLAAVWRLQEKYLQAESLLKMILDVSLAKLTKLDLVVANIYNNLGLLMKVQKRYDESLVYYQEALVIRESILGDSHADSIVIKHNLAELYLAKGDTKAGTELQDKIIEIIDRVQKASIDPAKEEEMLRKADQKAENSATSTAAGDSSIGNGEKTIPVTTATTTKTAVKTMETVVMHHTRRKKKSEVSPGDLK